MKVADGLFTDAEQHKTENWTTTDILANSSNVGTIGIAERLGKTALDQYLRKFGFGQVSAVNFPGESAGLLLNPAKWSGTSIATVAIGQGVAVTALQMLAAYNTIANGGTYVAPKLVAATIDDKGRQHPTPASARHQVVSPGVARDMTAMLSQVVAAGTGTAAKISGYTVAGKTGTARIPLEGARGYKDGVYASSFAGFVPAAAPALTGIVILDDTAQFGATSAAPTFASIARYGLQEFQVPPNATIPLVPGVPSPTPVGPGRGFGRDGSDPFGDAGHDPVDGAGQGDHLDLGDGQRRVPQPATPAHRHRRRAPRRRRAPTPPRPRRAARRRRPGGRRPRRPPRRRRSRQRRPLRPRPSR